MINISYLPEYKTSLVGERCPAAASNEKPDKPQEAKVFKIKPLQVRADICRTSREHLDTTDTDLTRQNHGTFSCWVDTVFMLLSPQLDWLPFWLLKLGKG